jgi:hypothetical protein
VFSVVEPCRTFSLVWKEHHALVRLAKRKCLQLYYYFMDRQLGLIHVKLQTWFPFPIQVYVNGHEWLARRLGRHGLKYLKSDNVFLHVSDLVRVQRLADGFEARDVMAFLGRKLNGNFQGDLVTDQLDFSQLPRRLPGRRVKHA